MSQEPEDVKPKLNLTITCIDQQITVKVKSNMKFSKIFGAAAERFGKDPGSLRFTYDGDRIQPNDTPAGLEMKDGDMVEVFLEQLGGALCVHPHHHNDSFV